MKRVRHLVTVGAAVALLFAGSFGVSSAAAQVGRAAITRTATVPADEALDAVSCPSLANCWVVGYAGSDPSHGRPLAEKWGPVHHIFRRVHAPAPSGLSESGFNGVSCVGSTYCVAVGAGTTAPPDLTASALAEHWNGQHWRLDAQPSADGLIGPHLEGVSCVSHHFCIAVGYSEQVREPTNYVPLIEKWNGSTWSLMPAAGSFLSASLNGVSCTSTSNCLAVGTDTVTAYGRALVEHWNGSAWSVVTSSDNPHSQSVQLDSTSCPTPTTCRSVGNVYKHHASLMRTLAEYWSAPSTSTFSRPRNRSANRADQLVGVSCPSATRCVAVGGADSNAGGSHQEPLAESWNGSTWAIHGTPAIHASTYSQLLAVSCLTRSDCFAAGDGEIPGGAIPVAERWNGHHWSLVRTHP